MKTNKDISNIKDHVKYSLILIIAIWLLSSAIPNFGESLMTGIVMTAATIFNFVNCIIYLVRGGSKGLGITSLVISSLYILLFFIGFIIGIVSGLEGI